MNLNVTFQYFIVFLISVLFAPDNEIHGVHLKLDFVRHLIQIVTLSLIGQNICQNYLIDIWVYLGKTTKYLIYFCIFTRYKNNQNKY